MKDMTRLQYFAENLYRKYFYIDENVVNPDHQPMSKAEIRRRDHLRKKNPAKNAKVVTGPKGRQDTPEEAKYRFATYLTLRGREKKERKD